MADIIQKSYKYLSGIISFGVALYAISYAILFYKSTNKQYFSVSILQQGRQPACSSFYDKNLEELVASRANEFAPQKLSTRSGISGYESKSKREAEKDIFVAYSGYFGVLDMILPTQNTIRIILHLNENCSPQSFEIFDSRDYSNNRISSPDFSRDIGKALYYFSDEYQQLYTKIDSDTAYVRLRAFSLFREGRDAKWYANLIGNTYSAEWKSSGKKTEHNNLLETAIEWWNQALDIDPHFLPSISNKIDANIIMSEYADQKYDIAIRELLRIYYINPRKGFLGEVGWLTFEKSFKPNRKFDEYNTHTFDNMRRSINFLEKELKIYGGSQLLFDRLSVVSQKLEDRSRERKYKCFLNSYYVARMFDTIDPPEATCGS